MAILVAINAFTWIQHAHAHRSGERYIYFNAGEQSLSGRFETPLFHLKSIEGVDQDGDGVFSEAEFEQAKPILAPLFEKSLEIEVGNQSYAVQLRSHDFLPVSVGTFVRWQFETEIAEPIPKEITVTHFPDLEKAMTASSDRVPTFLIVESNTQTGVKDNEARHAFIFDSGVDRRRLNLAGTPWLKLVIDFTKRGMKHILVGYDHLLFLLALLLPAVLVRREQSWQPVQSFLPTLKTVAWVVTFFTLAHSLTLSLAAIGWVNVHAGAVEALIAFSIILAALANLIALPFRGRLPIIFGLGLLHGLGFANVLAPYGIEPINLVPTLLAFNFGIEIGQLAFVLVLMPILYLLRKNRAYVPVILWLGSIFVILVALRWLIQRLFGVSIPGFGM